MENFHKNQPKSLEYHTIFFKTIKLMFTDINIYPMNMKTDFGEIYFFYRKKKIKQKLIFSLFQVGFGAGSGSEAVISRNGSEDLDPYKNETDPKH